MTPLDPDEALDQFEVSLLARNKRPATVTHYVGAARQFLEWHGSAEFGRGDVERWLVSLRGQYRPASIQNRYKGLKAFARWLIEEDELTADPFEHIPVPFAEEVDKDIVSEPDMKRMLRHLERRKRWRDAFIIATLYDTGLRASEFVSLEATALNRKTGEIIVQAESTKGRRPRVVHLSPMGIVYFDRYMRHRPKSKWMLIGMRGKMTASGLLQVVKACFEEIGLPNIGPHDLRHTSASHSLGHMSDSSMLQQYGWKNARMLERYTTQRRQQVAIEEHRRSSPLERLSP